MFQNIEAEGEFYEWPLSQGDELILKEVLSIEGSLKIDSLVCDRPTHRCVNETCGRQLGFLDIITTAFRESDHGAKFFNKFLSGKVHSHHSPAEDGNIVRCCFCDREQGYRLKYNGRKWCR